ncbi:MAG: hypothetical protein Q4D14_06540 [Bacteroidales bacterium]|nr:hypothetical protein [Bacteroidales bacterium]
MFSVHDESFKAFEEKLYLLIQELTQLREENTELTKQLSELTQQLQDAQLSTKQIQRNYETLKTAKAFGQSEEDKKRAYRRISRLVNDIDSCIQLLKD